MSETPGEVPKSSRSSPLLLLAAIFVPVIVIVAAIWYVSVSQPLQASREFTQEVVLRTAGLGKATVNRLDPRFADANNDLVADMPADPAQQIDPPVLYFSYIAVEEPEHFRDVFKEFIAHLSKATGKPVEYQLLHSTGDQLKALRDGQLHICGLNTGAVPMAVDLCGFVPIGKLASSDGIASYRMQLIVPAKSTLKSAADLRDQELTVTEPGSNSGFKAPLELLRDVYGLEPERDYRLRYSHGHDESIAGIASGEYAVAAVAGDVLRRAVARGDIKTNQFRIIYESEAFPTAAIGQVYNLKPELAEKIRQAIFDFDWNGTEMAKEFAQSEQSKFVPANFKDDWSLVRKIDDHMGTTYKID